MTTSGVRTSLIAGLFLLAPAAGPLHPQDAAPAAVTPDAIALISGWAKERVREELFARQAGNSGPESVLLLFALLRSGSSPLEPRLVERAKELLARPPEGIYDDALKLMLAKEIPALGAFIPARALIADLLSRQTENGLFGYTGASRSDLSCTQFALLGMRAARDLGEEVPPETAARVLRTLPALQAKDGGFGYVERMHPSLSMTAGAISTLAIAADLAGDRADPGDGERVKDAVKRALAWLRSPAASVSLPTRGGRDGRLGYAWFGLKRAMNLLPEDLRPDWDWFEEGVRSLANAYSGEGGKKESRRSQSKMCGVEAAFLLLYLSGPIERTGVERVTEAARRIMSSRTKEKLDEAILAMAAAGPDALDACLSLTDADDARVREAARNAILGMGGPAAENLRALPFEELDSVLGEMKRRRIAELK